MNPVQEAQRGGSLWVPLRKETNHKILGLKGAKIPFWRDAQAGVENPETSSKEKEKGEKTTTNILTGLVVELLTAIYDKN